MARKELTETQAKFRKAILKELKPNLQWYNDCVNVQIDFEDDEHFHLHIIEDYECHLHIRGEIDDDSLNIMNVTNHSVSQDIFDETMDFVKNYEF